MRTRTGHGIVSPVNQQEVPRSMPQAWSNKRERQYEHIEESEKKQGRSTGRAKEIAARTVNKQRSQAGETKSSSSSRSGGASSRKKTTSSRSTAKKSTAKKSTAKKSTTKKSTARKSAPKKS